MARIEDEIRQLKEEIESLRVSRSMLLTPEELAAEEEAEIEKFLPVLEACWPYLDRGEPIPDEALASLPESEWGWTRTYLPEVHEMYHEGYFDTEEDDPR